MKRAVRKTKWRSGFALASVLTLAITSVVAASAPKSSSTAVSTSPLVDATGSVFGVRTVVSASATEENPEAVVTAGSRVLRKSEIDLLRPDTGGVDAIGTNERDALGVIVELNDAPALEIRGKAIRERVPNAEAEARVGAQRSLIAQAHRRVIDRGTLVFGPGRSRRIEYSDALNAVAFLDVGVNEAVRKLGKHPDVKRISPNGKVRTQLLDSVPQVKANQVWSFVGVNSTSLDGSGMKIGIIDTGVDYRHLDLGGCFGTGCKVSGGYDFVNGDSDPMDDHGHGTHVAATAAGSGILSGVAPGAKIYAYKVLGADGSGFNTAIISAIERCYTDHLDVCSMSLGGVGNPDDPMSIAVDNATLNGVVFTVAAGNSGPSDGTISSPGTSRRAITVAAACKTADVGVDPTCPSPIAQFSSRGPVAWTDASGVSRTIAKPDLAAPGHKICAAQWGSAWSDRECLDGNHVSISGTSMATPHIAGVAALIRQAHPEFTPDQVKNVLVSSAVDLGQSKNAQGSGLVDAANALSLSGIPSGVAQISGVPLALIDDPTALVGTYSRVLTIRNTSGQSLTYAPSFATAQTGFTATFDRSQIAIAAGGTASLTATFRIDHSVVASPQQLNGTITVTTSVGVAKVGVSVYVRDRLLASEGTIDFGVDLPTVSTWVTSHAITLTNVMMDTSASYSVSIDMPNAAITAAASPAIVALAPGGSVPLTVTLTANNGALANTRYSGTLRLTSSTQNLSIPITFFKGYGIRFGYGSETAPTYIQYHQGNAAASLMKPSTTASSTILYVTTPGPWSSHGLWMGEVFPVNSAHVVRDGLNLTQPITDVSMRRSDATHTLSFNPTTPSGGGSLPNSTFKWGLIHRSSGNKMDVAGGTFSGGQVKVSDIPSSYTFLASAGGVDSSGALATYLYRMGNGITTDLNLTNTAGSFVRKNITGFQNQDSGSGTVLSPNLCLPVYLGTASVNLAGSCFNASWVKTTIGAGQLGTAYAYNYGAEDLSTAVNFDYPFFQFYSAHPSDTSGFPFLYRSPLFYVTPTKTFAYTNAAAAGGNLRNFLVDAPLGDFLSVGVGPLYDSSRWYNYADNSVSLSSQRGLNLPFHLWGDASDEWITLWNGANLAKIAASYVLSKDGTVVASGSVTATNGTKLSVAPPLVGNVVQPGNYRFELTRPAMINGKSTQTKTISTFRVVTLATHQSSPVDENPPAVTGIHLLADGIWQNVIDPARTNVLSFQIDPVPGFLNASTLMTDVLLSTTLEMSIDGGTSWNPIPLTGGYNATVPAVAGVSLYYFRIKAADAAGNTLTHSFQIPGGTAFSPPIADTQAPITTIASPTSGQVLSGMVNPNATATDNIGVTKVEWLRNGSLVATQTASPYTYAWNTALTANGTYTLQTRAYDAAGNVGTSAPVTVTVQNSLVDTVPPAVSITTPLEGGGVAKRTTVAISATATDNVGVARVDLYVNGVLLCSDGIAPYSCAWKTPNKAGSQKIQAYAFDQAGNVGTATVNVTVK